MRDQPLDVLHPTELADSLLRVFDDGSIILKSGGWMYFHPVGAPPSVEHTNFLGFDGPSIDDFWYLMLVYTPPEQRGNHLVHRLGGAVQSDDVLPALQGAAQLAVGPDGSVYLGGPYGVRTGVFRYAHGELAQLAENADLRRFRRGGDHVYAFIRGAIFYFEGASIRPLTRTPYVDVIGSPDDYLGLRANVRAVIDGCHSSGPFSQSCGGHDETVDVAVERVSHGVVTELGHAICDGGHHDVCRHVSFALGNDGASTVVVGDPFLRLPR